MRKLAVALGAAALVTLALVAARRSRPGPEHGRSVESPRGAADLGGPVGGQHRRVRVPLARQARHADDRQQLHPRRGSRGRAELLHVLADRPVRHLRRPERRRQAGRLVLLPVPAEDRAVLPRRHRPAVHGDAGREREVDGGRSRARRRPTTSGLARLRTTTRSRRRRSPPLSGGGQVFAGQRDDPFFADVGDIFDLLAIRKGTGDSGGGKDFLAGYAVHTIALQIPISQVDTASHTIGVWSAADRRRASVSGKGTAASGCRSRASAIR